MMMLHTSESEGSGLGLKCRFSNPNPSIPKFSTKTKKKLHFFSFVPTTKSRFFLPFLLYIFFLFPLVFRSRFSLLARRRSQSSLQQQHSFMDCNQNFQEQEAQSQYNNESPLESKCNYALASAEESENSDNCFDCNICLDSAQDPVVTLCGHLYCWSCIFEWLHVQTSSTEPLHQGQSCPVCKAAISHASLVPLFARCSSLAEQEEKRSRLDLCRLHTSPYSPSNSAVEGLGGGGAHMGDDPTQVMIGELFHRRILWSFMGFFVDPSPNSYYSVISRTGRMRRQEMQADKCLNRVSIFLLCCLILCLVTF